MSISIKRKRTSNNPLLGGLFMLIIGLGLTTVLSRTVLKDAKASESWLTATGIVTTSEIRETRSGDGYSYSPRILYDYQVEDETYSSGRITVADGGSGRSERAESMVEQYPVGEEVEVFYNPEIPSQSLLERSVPTTVRFINWGGMAFAAIGVLVIIRTLFRFLFALLGIGRRL